MKKRTIKFIPDSEINLLEKENDILGTSVYVETIRQIVENPDIPTPYTIGLFGSWGSGKSSIIKTLKEIYEKENKNIKVFIKIFCFLKPFSLENGYRKHGVSRKNPFSV